MHVPGAPFWEPLHNSAAVPHLSARSALEGDESSDDSAYTESDGSEPEMIEDGAVDSDMMDATDDISSGDDLVPMEGAPTE